jgi:ABC-type transport system involved in cytochrome bd biosynthesis fused ATPase/permease subunit
MTNKACSHYVNRSYMKDIVVIILVVIGVLIMREGLSWLLKTNHAHTAIKTNQRLIQQVISTMDRNGLR